jgi:hypothetical protein
MSEQRLKELSAFLNPVIEMIGEGPLRQPMRREADDTWHGLNVAEEAAYKCGYAEARRERDDEIRHALAVKECELRKEALDFAWAVNPENGNFPVKSRRLEVQADLARDLRAGIMDGTWPPPKEEEQ